MEERADGPKPVLNRRKRDIEAFVAEEKEALENGTEGPPDDAPLAAVVLGPIEKLAVRPLGKSGGGRGCRRPKGPPPKGQIDSYFMTTAEAAVYCRFRTTGGLRKAWYKHEVFPSGRRGGRNTLMWKKGELDRFLCGIPIKASEMAGLLLPESGRSESDE